MSVTLLTAGPQLLISQHYTLKSTVDAVIGEQLKKCTFKQEQPPIIALKGNTEKSCQQGRLGNCWFCATAAALSSNVKLYAKNIQKLQPQTFEESDYFGIFHFRFYHLGDWIDVVIDDYLPTIDGSLIFAHSKVEEAIKGFQIVSKFTGYEM